MRILFAASARSAIYAERPAVAAYARIALARKPSGCVLSLQFDPTSMELGPFLWFGGEPGAPLPHLGDRIGKHSKGDSTGHKAERPNIRMLRHGQFETLPTMDSVVVALFGHMQAP